MVNNQQAELGIIGVSSCYFPRWEVAQRIIREDVYVPEADMSIYAIARGIIMTQLDLHKRKRANFHPTMMETLQWPQPLHATPGIYPFGCYVDINSFYYSIFSRVTWDLYYKPGYGIGEGRIDMSHIWPTLRPHKLLRNSIVGMCRKTTVNRFRAGKVVTEAYYNRLLNPNLYCLINDIAHAIAYEAVHTYGAVYYNTDGAVFANEKALESFRAFVQQCGFETSIKGSGETLINGCSSYRVGNLGKAQKYLPAPYHNIRQVPLALAYWQKYLRTRGTK